jgi:hypothetical protein
MSDKPTDEKNVSTHGHGLTEWTVEHENILIEWADKAMCFRWLHSKANVMYSSLNTWYTIPVIVISTLTGTANFAQDRVPAQYQNLFSMVVGGFNILAGIITTIQQFLKVTQLNEAHRVSSIAWDKFYRNIKIELSKHPDERTDVSHMIKLCKEEFDRLMETSPIIPDEVIKQFTSTFKKMENYNIIKKPEICDELISTEKSRNPWANDENVSKKHNLTKLKQTKDKNIVIDFKKSFYSINYREPLDSEILDNLKDKIDINILSSIIDDLNKMMELTVYDANNEQNL